MEASHTESLAAHYFRSGKLLIQIVLAPSPQSNRLSIAGNVSVPFSSICSTSCGQMAGLEGLLAVLRVKLQESIASMAIHYQPRSDHHAYQTVTFVSPSTFGRHNGFSPRGWNHPPCCAQPATICHPLMSLNSYITALSFLLIPGYTCQALTSASRCCVVIFVTNKGFCAGVWDPEAVSYRSSSR